MTDSRRNTVAQFDGCTLLAVAPTRDGRETADILTEADIPVLLVEEVELVDGRESSTDPLNDAHPTIVDRSPSVEARRRRIAVLNVFDAYEAAEADDPALMALRRTIQVVLHELRRYDLVVIPADKIPESALDCFTTFIGISASSTRLTPQLTTAEALEDELREWDFLEALKGASGAPMDLIEVGDSILSSALRADLSDRVTHRRTRFAFQNRWPQSRQHADPRTTIMWLTRCLARPAIPRDATIRTPEGFPRPPPRVGGTTFAPVDPNDLMVHDGGSRRAETPVPVARRYATRVRSRPAAARPRRRRPTA